MCYDSSMSLECSPSSPETNSETDIFPKKILGYDFVVHQEEKFNMMDHLNPAPIELMGVLSEKQIQAYIGDIATAFPDISHAQINAIIQRESGGVPDPDRGSQDQKW